MLTDAERRTGYKRQSGRRNQHLHLQSSLPGSRICQENGVVSAQSTRRARRRSSAVPDPARPLGGRRRALDQPGWPRRPTPHNEITGSRCSRPATLSVDSLTYCRIPGKGIQRNHPVFLDDSSKHGVSATGHSGGRQNLTGYDGSSWPPAWHRIPAIPGIDHPMVLTYAEITVVRPVGRTVAVVGAGGINFDVTELLVCDSSPTPSTQEWKADEVTPAGVDDSQPPAVVYLLQRTKARRVAARPRMGPRASLAKGVRRLSGVNYEQINDDWPASASPKRRRPQLLAVDNVVVCAGQEPVRDLEVNCAGTAITRTSSVARRLPLSWT